MAEFKSNFYKFEYQLYYGSCTYKFSYIFVLYFELPFIFYVHYFKCSNPNKLKIITCDHASAEICIYNYILYENYSIHVAL